MRAILILLLLSTTLLQPATANTARVSGCDEPTTIAQTECRVRQIDAANAKLQQYLDAARKRVLQFGVDPTALQVEQAAWENYRLKHCGNVYDLWAKGTIRYEMSASCTLLTTRQRTFDVWRAYLTFLDSTPPLLPDPSQ